MAPRILALAALCSLVVACRSPSEEEAAACADVICAEGTCGMQGAEAVCRCAPVDAVLGRNCRVLTTYNDEFGDTFDDAHPLPIPARVSGFINAPRTTTVPHDRDVFRIDGAPGELMRIGCSGIDIDPCRVQVFDTRRQEVIRFFGPSIEYFVRTEHGIGFVVIHSDESDTGGYVLEVSTHEDDHPDTVDSASPLAVPAALQGQIEVADDVDVFRFDAQVDRAYALQFEASAALQMDLLGADGALLAHREVAHGAGRVAVRGHSGPVFVRVRVPPKAHTASYSGSLIDMPFDDHPDDLSSATAVALPVVVDGIHEIAADVDVFTAETVADLTYAFSCTAPAGGCLVSLRDHNGVVIAPGPAVAWNSDGGRVFFSVSTRGMGGPYRVEVQVGGLDEFGDTSATATTIGFGEHPGGFQAERDEDWVQFTIDEDHYYNYECVAAGGTCAAQLQPGPERRGTIFSLGQLGDAGTSGVAQLRLTGDAGVSYVLRLDRLADNGANLPARADLWVDPNHGTFEVGWDVDCFRVPLDAGSYTFDGTWTRLVNARVTDRSGLLLREAFLPLTFAPTVAAEYGVCLSAGDSTNDDGTNWPQPWGEYSVTVK